MKPIHGANGDLPISTTFDLPGFTVEFDSSVVGGGLAEIIAYGTAAVVRPA